MSIRQAPPLSLGDPRHEALAMKALGLERLSAGEHTPRDDRNWRIRDEAGELVGQVVVDRLVSVGLSTGVRPPVSVIVIQGPAGDWATTVKSDIGGAMTAAPTYRLPPGTVADLLGHWPPPGSWQPSPAPSISIDGATMSVGVDDGYAESMIHVWAQSPRALSEFAASVLKFLRVATAADGSMVTVDGLADILNATETTVQGTDGSLG